MYNFQITETNIFTYKITELLLVEVNEVLKMSSLVKFSLSLFVTTLCVYILMVGQRFFLPLVIAGVIGYFIIAIVQGMRKVQVFGRPMPYVINYMIAIAVISLAFWVVITVVSINIQSMIELGSFYQERLNNLIDATFQYLGKPQKFDLPTYFKSLDLNFVSLASQAFVAITDLAGNLGIIALYVVFMLIEHHFFSDKLDAFFQKQQDRNEAKRLIDMISSQIQSYIRIKTFLSTATALLSYALLVWVGVDFPNFWAFLIFLLNFIPTIGSIFATIFPSLLSVLQFDEWLPIIVVVVGLTLIQVVIGNFLEPKIMGKSFNLSGFVIVVALTFWGMVWGIVGMFLCVPILVIVSIILANFPTTRPIAVLLSQDGNVN